MKISVKVTPNAKTNEVVRQEGNLYYVRIRAKAVDGQANRSLIEFLADYFKVRKADVRIVSGETARIKIIEVIQ